MHCTETKPSPPKGESGKWMTFHSFDTIDNAWKKAKSLVDAGMVGTCRNIKVHTIAASKLENQTDSVIIWYALDDAKCIETGKLIVNEMQYLAQYCYYKLDSTTLANISKGTYRCVSSHRILGYIPPPKSNDN